ncbi:uncharacterized protein LOC120073573 [Benincasa hispida]|uniref:uncharacterized protein LOC120073573 n=1 Tax=Benincasa hispida TaxID=102211 RepID=UPI001901F6B5|nr:uncharacterized protein LOC120073573 [Benincasa hispida]
MRCPEKHKLQCAVFMLTDNAKIWWHSTKKTIDTSGELAIWEQFNKHFYEKYFSANTRYNKPAEFLNLKQGVMSMEEYAQEFDKLSHFTHELIATEAVTIERFIQGLRSGLRGMVHAMDLKTYDAALRAAVSIHSDSQVGEEYRKLLEIGTSIGQKMKVEPRAPKHQQRNQNTVNAPHQCR